MNDSLASLHPSGALSSDERLKGEFKNFYESLNSAFLKANWDNGKIVIGISMTQILQNAEISSEWLVHSTKQETERELLASVNHALDASFDSESRQIVAFYKRMIESSMDIQRLVQSGIQAGLREDVLKINQAVKSETVYEKSANEDISVVFEGGRRFSSITISQELFDAKDCRTIAGRIIEVLNKSISSSRNKLMNKFGPPNPS